MSKTQRRKPIEPWQLADSVRLKALWDEFKVRTKSSQEGFCAEHGLGSQANMGHYLHGRQGLTIDTAARFAKGLGLTINAFSPTLASQVNSAHEFTEMGKLAWPFPNIDRARFDRLEESQRYEIQGLVRERIERFEAANGTARPLGAPVAPEHLETLTRLSEAAEAQHKEQHAKKQRRRSAA